MRRLELEGLGWTTVAGGTEYRHTDAPGVVVDLWSQSIKHNGHVLLRIEDDPRSMVVLLDIAAHAALDRALELSRVYIALAQTYDSDAGTRSTVDEPTDGQE